MYSQLIAITCVIIIIIFSGVRPVQGLEVSRLVFEPLSTSDLLCDSG